MFLFFAPLSFVLCCAMLCCRALSGILNAGSSVVVCACHSRFTTTPMVVLKQRPPAHSHKRPCARAPPPPPHHHHVHHNNKFWHRTFTSLGKHRLEVARQQTCDARDVGRSKACTALLTQHESRAPSHMFSTGAVCLSADRRNGPQQHQVQQPGHIISFTPHKSRVHARKQNERLGAA